MEKADFSKIFANVDVGSIVPKLIVSVIVIIIAIVVWKLIKKGYNTYNEKQYGKEKSDKNISNGLINIVKYIIVIVVVLAVLQINGINVGGLIASLGITGAILGLAIQDFLKDVVMGAHIRSDHFFKMDDVIKFDGHEGAVIFFNSKTTKIRDIYTNEVITICNRELTKVVKSSSQVDMDLMIPYDIEPSKVHETLGKLAEKIGEVENIKNCVYKGTQEFKDCGIIYKLRFFCSPHKRPDLWRAAMRIVQDGLDEAGIPIAVPIQEVGVTMRNDS